MGEATAARRLPEIAIAPLSNGDWRTTPAQFFPMREARSQLGPVPIERPKMNTESPGTFFTSVRYFQAALIES